MNQPPHPRSLPLTAANKGGRRCVRTPDKNCEEGREGITHQRQPRHRSHDKNARVNKDENLRPWRCSDCGARGQVPFDATLSVAAVLAGIRAGHRSASPTCAGTPGAGDVSAIGRLAAQARLPEYRVWRSMLYRCFSPKSGRWKDYGGRGITVCERWRTSFASFYDDMGARPSPDHSIDRKNNDGNYEPGNCRWATALEQRHNQRPLSRKE